MKVASILFACTQSGRKKKAKTWLDYKQKGIDITFKKTYS